MSGVIMRHGNGNMLVACPLLDCDSEEVNNTDIGDSVEINCAVCGTYRMTRTFYASAQGDFRNDSNRMEGLRAYIHSQNSQTPPNITEIIRKE